MIICMYLEREEHYFKLTFVTIEILFLNKKRFMELCIQNY